MTKFSLNNSFGGYAFTTAAATTIATAGTAVKAAGTTTKLAQSVDVDAGDTTDNRFVYEGATLRTFKVDAAVAVAPASGTNQDISLVLAKNGTAIANTKVQGRAASTAAINLAMTAVVEVDTDDYLELFVANETGTVNVQVENGSLTAVGFQR